MTITYASGIIAGDSGTGTTATFTLAGGASRQLLLVVIGFEGVAPGSGPWVTTVDGSYTTEPFNGWKRICWQAPSATGNGLEIWAAIWTSSSGASFGFGSSLSYVGVGSAYTGHYDSGGGNGVYDGTVRGAVTAQVTGNDPAAPSIFAFQNELVVPCGSDQMGASGFGTPVGYNLRTDVARGGSHGNVEAAVADALALASGATGAVTFPQNAVTGTTNGATATLAIRPATPPPVSTAPMVVAEYR